LRKENFVNPSDGRTDCTSLGDEYALSAQLIIFTDLAKKARQEYIIEVSTIITQLLYLGQYQLPNKKQLHKK